MCEVNIAKQSDILQATFEHYFKMAMDHHTKAATTSNILLAIVGVIIGLVYHDKVISSGAYFIGGLAVFVIGLFGVVWVRKQHERYHCWQFIAYKYQEELTKIVPGLRTGKTYEDEAEDYTATEMKFWCWFAKKLKDRYLWMGLHIIVAVIGFVLMAIAFWVTPCGK